jgi:hypothetical protein
MTTQAETFDTTDSDTLGPVLSWTEESGDIDIVSNRARVVDIGDNHARARAPALATANHYAQAVVRCSSAAGSGGIGVMLRKNSATGTKTYYLIDVEFASQDTRYWKCETGSFTALGTFDESVTFSADTNYTIYGSINGSSIEVKTDGVTKFSTSDSAIVGNLHTGIHFAFGTLDANFDLDSFEAADIVLPPGPITAPSLNCWIGGYW